MFASNDPSPRRSFLARMSAAAVAFSGLSAAAPLTVLHAAEPDEAWLRALTGKHRTALDIDSHKHGTALVQAKNLLDAWKNEYRLESPTVNVVMSVHGTGLPIVLNDALWAKYKLGEQYGITDPVTKVPALRNPFITANVQPQGLVSAEQTVEALQGRGVAFLICRNSLAGGTRKLVAAGLGSATEVRAALEGGLLPRVTIVPAMVLALTQMQERGVSYVFAG